MVHKYCRLLLCGPSTQHCRSSWVFSGASVRLNSCWFADMRTWKLPNGRTAGVDGIRCFVSQPHAPLKTAHVHCCRTARQATGTTSRPPTKARLACAGGETTSRSSRRTCASSSATPAGGGCTGGAAASCRLRRMGRTSGRSRASCALASRY